MKVPIQMPVAAVCAAWLMFFVSLFLPTFSSGGTGLLTGWAASTTAWRDAIREAGWLLVAILFKPGLLLLFLVPFINLVMLVAPLPALLWDKAWLLAGLLFGFGLLTCAVKLGSGVETSVGFYLWVASFFLMAIACVLKSIHVNQSYAAQIRKLRAGSV
jgi:hypothetical protein